MQFRKSISLAGMVLSGAALSISQAQEPPKTNIILIVTDDQGFDLGCYGNTRIKTPALDELASEGVLFNRAYCTSASSSASRTVILTGLYNHANGHYGHSHVQNHFRTFESVVSLPRIMSDNGYRTAHIGKWHLAPDEVYPFQQKIASDARNTVEMAEKSARFIGESDKPFFLYFCPYDSHDEGKHFENLPYKPDTHGNDRVYPGVTEVKYHPDSVLIPPFLPDRPEIRAWLAQYYQSISRLDQGVGRLMQFLKDNKLWDNTIIVFASDNGINLTGGKTNTYEPGIGVPFIIRSPYAPAKGVATKALVNYADITPTILDMAGLLPKDNRLPDSYFDPNIIPWEDAPQRKVLQGRSLVPVLNNPNVTGWDTTYASHTFHGLDNYYPMRVVITRRYKLIVNLEHELPYPVVNDAMEAAFKRNPNETYGAHRVGEYIYRPLYELFDLEKDPYETKNLAYLPEFAGVRDELVKKIRSFQKNTNDPFIVKWKLYDAGIRK